LDDLKRGSDNAEGRDTKPEDLIEAYIATWSVRQMDWTVFLETVPALREVVHELERETIKQLLCSCV
jgi:hypothetical protein